MGDPVPVAARSKARVCSRRLDEIVGSNPRRGHGCSSVVSVVCCQVERLGDELITRPEESYRLWCVVVCVLETSRMSRFGPQRDRGGSSKLKVL